MEKSNELELWLEDRRKHITGSDVAAIMLPTHLRPRWSDPVNVWLDKKGELEKQDNPFMAWGRRLEKGILNGYAEETGFDITYADTHKLIECPNFPLLGATLDATRVMDGRPVDAKNKRTKTDEYGEAWSSKIPKYYHLQLASQMACVNNANADLAVLFSGSTFIPYTIERDLWFEEEIKETIQTWWDKYIKTDTKPPLEPSNSSSKMIEKYYKQKQDKLIQPSEQAIDAYNKLCIVRRELKILEESQSKLEILLKMEIGENSGLSGLCTWKTSKDTTSIDNKAYVSELENKLMSVGISGSSIKEMRSAYTTTKQGSRRFLLLSGD